MPEDGGQTSSAPQHDGAEREQNDGSNEQGNESTNADMEDDSSQSSSTQRTQGALVDEEQKNCPADEELKELLLYIEHKVFNIRNEYNSATTLKAVTLNARINWQMLAESSCNAPKKLDTKTVKVTEQEQQHAVAWGRRLQTRLA